MKVYLASSFELVPYVEAIDTVLASRGHSVTSRWWHKDYKKAIMKPEEEWYQDEDVRAISQRNFDGIRNADVFLLVAHPKTPRKFNGANIELGFALALGKPCYSIGKLEKSAMYVSVKQLHSKADFLRFMGDLEEI